MLIGIYSPHPQSGKTTVATRLCEEHNFLRVPFAETLKEMTRPLLCALGYTDLEIRRLEAGDKSEEIPALGMALRKVYQTLGTEWGRQTIRSDIWLRCWEAKALRALASCRDVVVDDVRFENEAELVQRLGGRMWCVRRPEAGPALSGGHASEGALQHWRFDLTLRNDRTIQNLRLLVDEAMASP